MNTGISLDHILLAGDSCNLISVCNLGNTLLSTQMKPFQKDDKGVLKVSKLLNNCEFVKFPYDFELQTSFHFSLKTKKTLDDGIEKKRNFCIVNGLYENQSYIFELKLCQNSAEKEEFSF